MHQLQIQPNSSIHCEKLPAGQLSRNIYHEGKNITYNSASISTGSICLVRGEQVVGRASRCGHVTSAAAWLRSPLVATRCGPPVQEQATNINLLSS